MGLHVTPHGTFYVQRSLRTGEVVQVLPVKRPDMPSQLPSVDSLGITENFIESRRASLAADTARVSDSQGRLEQELASAGGESLLATGKAALAQTGNSRAGSGSTYSSNTHSSPLAQNYDGDVEMAYGSSAAGSAGAPPTSPASFQHTSHSGSGQSRSDGHRGSNMNYILSEDPHQPPSSLAMAPHMLPVRPWPDTHHEPTVSLPPFREIDSTRALTHEEELRREGQASSSRGYSSRRKSTASPRMTSLLRSSTSSMSHGHNTYNGSSSSSSSSSSNMISHGSEGSVSSAYSVSEANTPSVLSPGPEYSYCNSSNGYSPVATYAAVSPAKEHLGGFPPAASLPPSPLMAAPQKKNKTVWIIRTLEPRKTTSQQANGGDDYDDYEPQRVQTHVETHIVPWDKT
ncbi:hypothetical protein SCUCBS95973_007282 [Sporothrix curviconia]|uniref:Uncharacterized protein n=1 Tax=Sporothrix curviconia TaxID=1260050 RepID=A0ABP0CCF4_9PEZI